MRTGHGARRDVWRASARIEWRDVDLHADAQVVGVHAIAVGPIDPLPHRLAARFYGDESMWQRIYRANRDRMDPDDLRIGMQIDIPPLDPR